MKIKNTIEKNLLSISDRISACVRTLDIKQSEIAKKLGVTPSVLNNWMHRERVPDAKNLLNLCNLFDVSPEYILFGERGGLKQNARWISENSATRTITLPVLNNVQAGNWAEIIETGEDFETISLIGKYNPSHCFCLKVKGDSMEGNDRRALFEGETVVVDTQKVHENGSIVVACDEEGRGTIKQYKDDGFEKILVPFNKQYNVIPLTSEMRIVGVVRCKITDF